MRAKTVALLALLYPAATWAQVPAGGEFLVNSYTTSWQHFPAVGFDGAGNFVIVWTSYGQDGSSTGVIGRRFDAGGDARGAEFQVNTYTTGHQGFFAPDVAVGRAGHALVAWTGIGQDSLDILGQRFARDGTRQGGEFRVNTTTGSDVLPVAAFAPDGSFIVVWQHAVVSGVDYDIHGQVYDAAGATTSSEFRINTYVPGRQYGPRVGASRSGFVVVWTSHAQDGNGAGVFGQRLDVSGSPLGSEFQVNVSTTAEQLAPAVAAAPDGAFVVVWHESTATGFTLTARRYGAQGQPLGGEFAASDGEAVGASVASDEAGNSVFAFNALRPGGQGQDIYVRRFTAAGTPRGGEFRVNTYTTDDQDVAAVGADAAGNFHVVWESTDGSFEGIAGQRFGGLLPALLRVADGENGVLEVADTFTLATGWRNVNGAAQTFQGRSSGTAAPPGLALTLSLDADYGTVANGTVGTCTGPCFTGSLTGTRPPGHLDASFLETIQPDALGQVKRWSLHIGDGFTDVPRASLFYRFVETLLHRAITAGCGPDTYCPATSTTREQMAVFLLLAKEAAGYSPVACTTPVFGDVPASSPFCRWIEELARRGVVSGCGGGNYCPGEAVTREQMAVFVLRTLDPALNPPACVAGSGMFADVPTSSPFCRWIEELARRGVVTGCGGGNYCPSEPVTREQMAVFLTGTFGLTLYGP